MNVSSSVPSLNMAAWDVIRLFKRGFLQLGMSILYCTSNNMCSDVFYVDVNKLLKCVTYHAAALLIHSVSEWSRKAALLLLSVRLWSFRDSRGK